MCLAIPGRVEEITSDGLVRMGRVNFGGVVKRVCLDYVPEIAVGDYTIVHVGFAISKIDEVTAEETLATFRAMGVLDEELASEEEAFARGAARPQSNCPDGSCALPGSSAAAESATSTEPQMLGKKYRA
jgi:hydrogenase expression/formation protein HypC